MPKKILKIIGIIVAVIALIAVLFFIWTYIRMRRGDLVKWDNHWYTKEQLKAKYPPQYIEVPAKNTPEEVYAKFRQALLDNDIETALEQIRKEKREEYRNLLEKYKEGNEDLRKLGEIYPQIINKNSEYGNFSSYSYKFIKNNNEIDSAIEFEKNEYGYWEIDQI